MHQGLIYFNISQTICVITCLFIGLDKTWNIYLYYKYTYIFLKQNIPDHNNTKDTFIQAIYFNCILVLKDFRAITN